ncbi:hypothetical protein [Nostoc sp.]|uniref:hypothetical protein n=1 Tax=Nostoc sp. TaxID=1180 RepID=UPI002FFB29AD
MVLVVEYGSLGKLALGRLAYNDRPLGVALLATVLYVQKPKSAIAAPMPPLVKIRCNTLGTPPRKLPCTHKSKIPNPN